MGRATYLEIYLKVVLSLCFFTVAQKEGTHCIKV